MQMQRHRTEWHIHLLAVPEVKNSSPQANDIVSSGVVGL